MAGTPLLNVKDLEKTITLHLLEGKRVHLLQGVSFALTEGEFLGVVGPSGAGKSTLLKCIYRAYLSTGGNIHYHTTAGSVVDLATAEEQQVLELRRREIGYVSQFLRPPPRVTALDVVALTGVARGADRESSRQHAAELLSSLNIGNQLQECYPAVFSGGEQQRINVARALVDPPRLLLLDEPTSALDAENRLRVLELLEEAQSAGTGMIGVFHDPETLCRLADRVIVLDGGRVVETGTLSEVDIERYIGSQSSSA